MSASAESVIAARRCLSRTGKLDAVSLIGSSTTASPLSHATGETTSGHQYAVAKPYRGPVSDTPLPGQESCPRDRVITKLQVSGHRRTGMSGVLGVPRSSTHGAP